MSLKSQNSLLVSVNSLDYAKGKLDVRFKKEDPESEEMVSLINSIQKVGILNPLRIRPKHGGRYDVVAGNRRLTAARALRMEYVPATIDDSDPIKARRIAWIDNEIRKNNAVIEKAKGIAHIYEDIGIDRKIAIKKVKYMDNLKTEHPKQYYDLLATRGPKFVGKNVLSDTEPTPEFLEAFIDIAIPAKTQYQLLQTTIHIPAGTLEILEKAPNLSLHKAVALTHTKLRDYPEVIRESLAEKIIDPQRKMNETKVRHLVNQTIADLEAKRTTVGEDGRIEYGLMGSGMGHRSDPEENVDTPIQLDIPFSAELVDITSLLMKTIGKILHIQIPRGEIHYSADLYKPALEEFEKKLNALKKSQKVFTAEQAAILGRICKAIVDSAR